MQDSMKNFEIPLHDIKPIVEVHEYSLYYFLAATILAVILVSGIAYLLYKWIQKRNAYSVRKEHRKLLTSISLKDTKKAAYDITFYGATFKDDSQRHSEMYNNLIRRLEGYKYKKEVDDFDKETLGYFELYKEMCDV